MRAARSSRLTLTPPRAGEWRKNELTGELERFYFQYDATDEADQFPTIMVTVESIMPDLGSFEVILAAMMLHHEWSQRTCARVA